MRNYSNEDNDLSERDLDLFDLEKAGYWKSEHSGVWYEKAFKKAYRNYKKGELKIYNWVPVEDEKAIECLEEGMVPSFRAVEEMSHD